MYEKIKGFITTIPLMILLVIICGLKVTLFNIIFMYLVFVIIGLALFDLYMISVNYWGLDVYP